MHAKLKAKLLLSDSRMTVGRYSYGTPNVISYMHNEAHLHVGSFCSIADDVTIHLGGEHFTGWTTTYPLQLLFEDDDLPWNVHDRGDVRIGHDVWIGRGATILSGVSIGNGAVIGACSVVAKDIPPFAIVVGNPAKPIRYRLPDSRIIEIQRDPWWNWSDEKIRSEARGLMRT
jgi:acetyltransferase-like isoleucine patch superfamily enzyme